jgi:pilus assembly protein FimV
MEGLRAEGAAAARKATDAQSVIPDIDVSGAPLTAPQTDVTLQPVTVRGPSTDLILDVPTVKSTDSNVIDFEFDPGKTVQIEPEAAAAFAHDQTVVISPEHQEQARDLGVEIDLSALNSPAASIPPAGAQPPAAEQTQEMTFDFQLPGDAVSATTDITVPPTDISFDVPEIKPADSSTVDFALDTVSLDLGSLEKKETPPPAPVHDDHWYDVQTKFDLAKAYQEMGDKDGAREILAEVIKEGDPQQQTEANELLSKLG